MAKSRDSGDAGKKPKARAKGVSAPKASTAPKANGAVAAPDVATRAGRPADAAPKAASPTRRQVRQIARLVGRLEALGELEARRRRQLHVALEKGRKTKRHRQQVDRAAGRVGELIDRLRTLARELESPVPAAATVPPVAAAPKPAKAKPAATAKAAPKPAPKPGTAAAVAVRTPTRAAAQTPSTPAASRTRSKPANP